MGMLVGLVVVGRSLTQLYTQLRWCRGPTELSRASSAIPKQEISPTGDRYFPAGAEERKPQRHLLVSPPEGIIAGIFPFRSVKT